MSHPEQRSFFRAIIPKILNSTDINSVLEIGSYDVNGETRGLFPEGIHYTGVDLVPGPGVDVISFGHEVEDPDGSYDLVISAECFEHDSHWKQTLGNMLRLTKPGGYVVFTCASLGRPEHGTIRTDPEMSPGTQAIGSDYYRNLSKRDLEKVGFFSFSDYRVYFLPNSADLYFYGLVKGVEKDSSRDFVEITNEEIKSIKNLMPFSHKLVRFPLRAALLFGKETKISREFSFLYWTLAKKIVGRLGLDEQISRQG